MIFTCLLRERISRVFRRLSKLFLLPVRLLCAMLNQLTSAELTTLSPALKEQRLAELVDNARSANGSASQYIRARIHAFELRYEMTSGQLLERLRDSSQPETAEVAKWLFLIDTLERHGG